MSDLLDLAVEIAMGLKEVRDVRSQLHVASEGRAEVLAEPNLRVSAPGLLGNAREARIRPVGHQRRLEPPGT